jgi:hypothetical protein
LFCNKLSIKNKNTKQPSKGKENSRPSKTITGGKGGRKGREKNGNAARENSCCGPICHMMGVEVCTSVYFPGLPRGRRRKHKKKL